ncbi:MerR family transcriptional regulator [Orenia marismortui]|uniref:MerR-like DNA binding protein n=1 Tax=Orenia marismortui TaxID=46469 RepID=A0A4R8H083_9FIRM|nr:MerR family transcriptional regulator [Orenia marismortui]TDX52712.1 MerR-like DNA binding protein [Orenia marismortui]
MLDVGADTPAYTIGVVADMTDLTARQIRYYEKAELINPVRTKGNQRLYSKNDVERLVEIKELLNKGLNAIGIKKVLEDQ